MQWSDITERGEKEVKKARSSRAWESLSAREEIEKRRGWESESLIERGLIYMCEGSILIISLDCDINKGSKS